jgi:cell fate regulator YaaT (PSP1 superfamily)
MTATSAPRIAAVRFHKVGKLYHFDVSAHPELNPADFVIVETSRGRQLGQIAAFVHPEEANMRRLKPIKRPAMARDLLMKQLWEAKEDEALEICQRVGAYLTREKGVKFVQAKYNYDGSLLALLYTSEEPNIDTGRLRRRLEQEFNTRIEVRRIGTRDAAKLLGEYGACGAERCCSTHLAEFCPISIRMAKAQGVSLNPSEITGMCGRLRCCLLYEHEQYVEALETLPRRNRRLGTPHGEGKVIEVNALKQTVTVDVDGSRHEVHKDDLMSVEEWRAQQEEAARHARDEAARISSERAARGSSRPRKRPPVQQQRKAGTSRSAPKKKRPRKRRSRGSDRSSGEKQGS